MEDEEEGEAEGDEDRDAAPHGLRCMDPTDPPIRNSFSDVGEMISARSARESAAQDEGGSKEKGKREEERGEQAEAAPRACKG